MSPPKPCDEERHNWITRLLAVFIACGIFAIIFWMLMFGMPEKGTEALLVLLGVDLPQFLDADSVALRVFARIEVELVPPCADDLTRPAECPESQLDCDSCLFLHVGRFERREERIYFSPFQRPVMYCLGRTVFSA